MDEAGEKGGWSEVDWLSNLPESLIIQVLLKLGTKDVVRCSALSSRWRNLWKYIPKLELEDFDFFTPNEMDPDCPSHFDRCVSFVDRFLGFNSDSCLESFKFVFSGYIGRDPDYALTRRWMETLIKRKVKHLEYLQDSCESDEFQIPPTIHTCESLVYLKLCGVTMSTPEFVALPFLKGMDLVKIKFLDDFDIERLISGCSVLENLFIVRSFSHDIRVCSQSLLTFTLDEDTDREFVENHLVVIDAPRLEYLELNDHFTPSFIIKYPSSLAKVFYEYSRCEPLPLFGYLSSLRVKFTHYSWEMLPIFLESCPNLKYIVLDYIIHPEKGIDILPGPRCFLASLEHVKIASRNMKEIGVMKLVSYFFENSPVLKKLTLYLGMLRNKKEVLKELLTMPRLSPSCQVVL